MKRIFALVLILAVAVAGLAAQTEIKTLAIEYPPYTTASSPTGGMTIELIQAALGGAYKLTPVVVPPARAAAEMAAGNNALSTFSADYSKNPEIVQVKNTNTLIVFFYNKSKGELSWSALADLKGKRMGTTRITGSAGASGLMKPIIDAGVLLDENDNIEDAFKKLHAGRIDFVFSVDLTGYTIIQKLFPGDTTMVPMAKAYQTIPGGPYFNTKAAGGEKLMKDFQAGWATIAKNGQALAIMEKYFGKGKVPADAIIK